MEEKGKGVNLKEIINEFQLETLYMGDSDVVINTPDVNRPGLPLTGFTELYQPHRLQIIGREEHAYLGGLDDNTRRANIEKFMAGKPICVIVSSSIEPYGEFKEFAEKYAADGFSEGQDNNWMNSFFSSSSGYPSFEPEMTVLLNSAKN
jgi:HPr kinase/phosphorylase